MDRLAADDRATIPASPRSSPVIPSPNGKGVLIQVVPEGLAAGREHDASSCTGCATTSIPAATRGHARSTCTSAARPRSASTSPTRSGQRLPYMFLAILLLSFVLLMLVFRSLLVPLKAVIMNLLSIGAAYGVIVAIFQWGWLKSLVGIGKEGPIEAWVPMMLFAIVFGLSMDYEVFLLSRIKEEYDRDHDNADAVAHGLAKTGAAHHRRGRDHDLRVRQLRALRPPRAEADRLRARVRGVHRRDRRAARARARDDGAARRPQLVVPAGSGSCPRSTSRASASRSPPATDAVRAPHLARNGRLAAWRYVRGPKIRPPLGDRRRILDPMGTTEVLRINGRKAGPLDDWKWLAERSNFDFEVNDGEDPGIVQEHAEEHGWRLLNPRDVLNPPSSVNQSVLIFRRTRD